jgi:hypothetical protein
MQVQIKLVSIIEQGAFGVLLVDSIPIAVTLWRTFEMTLDGYRMVINPGKYTCTRDWYYKGKYPTFAINVPGHDRVLFHIGNTEEDSLGCILVGEEFGVLNGKPAILRSGVGFFEFIKRLHDVENEFKLEVTYAG